MEGYEKSVLVIRLWKKKVRGFMLKKRFRELAMKFNSKRYIVNIRSRREKLRKGLLESQEPGVF